MNPIPFRNGGAVTPSDATALPVVTRAIWVGGAGNLAVTLEGGMNVTFNSVPAGTRLDIAATHVRSTSTTATNILWLV